MWRIIAEVNCSQESCPHKGKWHQKLGKKEVQKYLRFLPKALWDTMSEEQKKMYLAHIRKAKNIFDPTTLNNHSKRLPSQYGSGSSRVGGH